MTEELGKSIQAVDFRLKDRFCDAEGLKESCRSTKIPDQLITFIYELFSIKKLKVHHPYYLSVTTNYVEGEESNQIL